MKAWHITDGDDAHMLVFAETLNRARYMALRHGTWEFEEYVYIRGRRVPQWDGLFDVEKVVDTNADLPAGALPFYNDGDFE